jgi:hypothetical protein
MNVFNTKAQLIQDLNNLITSISGDSMSQGYKDILNNFDHKTIKALIEEQKEYINESSDQLDEEIDTYLEFEQSLLESERCDSIEYCAHEGFTGKF